MGDCWIYFASLIFDEVNIMFWIGFLLGVVLGALSVMGIIWLMYAAIIDESEEFDG